MSAIAGRGPSANEVSAVVLTDPASSQAIHTFRIGIDWTITEHVDPVVPGKRAWEVRQHTMLMEAKGVCDGALDAARRNRAGWRVEKGTFALPTGLTVALRDCVGPAARPAAAERVARVLVQAWEVSRAGSLAGPAHGRGAAGGSQAGKGRGPRNVVSVADRLAAFEERAMEALASVDTDPEGALVTFAELRDEQRDMEASLRRSASFLDSLEAVLGARFTG